MSILGNLLRSLMSRDGRAAPVAPQASDAALDPALKEIDCKLAHLGELSLRQLQIAGLTLRERILADHRYDDPLRLERFGWTVYSQNEQRFSQNGMWT